MRPGRRALFLVWGGILTRFGLPPEGLSRSVRAHPKCSALVGALGKLAPRFLVVANSETRDKGAAITAGNERVLRARLADDPLGLALRLGKHLLPLFDDPPGLLDLLGDRRAHLVEDVVDLLAVDAHLIGERDRLRVVHEVVELVDQYEDVHAGDGTRDAGSREVA